jgi:hypothetical protein
MWLSVKLVNKDAFLDELKRVIANDTWTCAHDAVARKVNSVIP